MSGWEGTSSLPLFVCLFVCSFLGLDTVIKATPQPTLSVNTNVTISSLFTSTLGKVIHQVFYTERFNSLTIDVSLSKLVVSLHALDFALTEV